MAGLDLHLHDHATSRGPRKAPDELAEEVGAEEDGVAPACAGSAREHGHGAMNGVVNGEKLALQGKGKDDDSMGDAPVQGEEEHQQQVHSTGVVSSASNGQEARGIAAHHQAPSPPPAAAADPTTAATDAPVVFSSAPTAASSSSPRSSPPPHQPPSFHVPSSLSSAPLDKAAAALNGVGGGLGSSGDALSLAAWGKRPLRCVDEEVWRIVEAEKQRQLRTIELIASENFVSQAVMEALGSPLCNKYSEGLPNARYYGGNHHIDAMENLCRARALAAFRLDPSQWGCNVQPYSCTSANLAVFTGLLAPPKDRIMGLDLPSGGHLSHGYITVGGKRVSAASVFFDTMPYRVHPVTGLLDYDRLEERAMDYRPRLLVCGGSAYPREWDFARMRRIADKCGAILMCDMAHISGLVAAQEHPSPFDYVDVVTSTTHKTLRGPRGGIIFYRRGPVVFGRYASASPTPPIPPPSTAGPAPAAAATAANGSSPTSASQQQQQQQPQLHVLPHPHQQQQYYDLEERINFAVFPTLQGGPHNNHTAALAVALGQVATPEFREYVRQVKRNAAALATALMRRGCRLVTNGTDNHIVLWDVRPLGLTGARMEKVCELCGITVNKNAVYGDATSLPGGIRLGTPAMTTRGCRELDMERIADLLVRAVAVAQRSLMPSAFLASAHSVTPSPSPSPWMSPKRQPSQHPHANGTAQDNHHPQQPQHPPATVGGGRDGDGAATAAGASTPNIAANATAAGPGASAAAAAAPPPLSATPSQHHHQQHHHQQQQKRLRLSESRSCGADWAEQLARSPEVEELRLAVEAFALSFGMPGYDLDLNLDPQVHSHHEHPAAISGRPEMCKGQLPQLSAEPHIDSHARCQQGESGDVARRC